MDLALLTTMNAERAARRATVLITHLASGTQHLLRASEISTDPLAPHLEAALRAGKSGVVGEGDGQVFLTVQVPPARIVVIGAVHISQAFAPMARLAGFDVTIVDPRTAFATPERFPDTPVIAEWPDTALPELALDPFTALVALTHDPKIDEPALEAALRADCFYVGALGSRRTHAKRLDRLAERGLSAAQLGRIHAPIGLDIGAANPPEIAVAVLGEVIAALRKPAPAREAAA